MLFAYFGPETLLPITSVIAGVAGVLMVLGKNTFRFLGLIWLGLRRAIGGERTSNVPPPPHIAPTPSSTPNALERRRAKARASQSSDVRDEHGQ